MGRKPNYAFERNERAKAKAAKRQAKQEAKAALKQADQENPAQPSDLDAPATPDSQNSNE